ncbi:competence protein ComK [Bacillus carboniphilus]|uniref:Competence protein ComK n=1 Tax=Bacillus carboniphilus TaxID=86663 RepID=A0ABY9JQ40_9BACI|nr:competence protein ComK [Bacillus carboniphilus]WLR41512.1 competence protein ComK [Bacillus carboniphilus]
MIIIPKTIALISKLNEQGESNCLKIDCDGQKLLESSSRKVIENNCLYNNTTLKASLSATKKILTNEYMLPILLSYEHHICMVTTKSWSCEDSHFISYDYQDRIKNVDDMAFLQLSDDKLIPLEIAYHILQKRFKSCSHLMMIYSIRNNYLRSHYIAERQSSYRINGLEKNEHYRENDYY